MQLKTLKNRIKFDGVVRKTPLQLSNVEYGTKKIVLYSGLKIASVFLIVSFMLVRLSYVGSTISYFNDTESSIGNYLRADPISFSVLVDGETSVQIDMSKGEQVIVPVMTPSEDSEPIQYFVMAFKTAGDDTLCSSIHTLNTFPFPYDGQLTILQTGTTTSVGSWSLAFSLPDSGQFSNISCNVDLIYQGWNADVPFGKGYRDTQKVHLTFYVPEQTINTPVTPVVETPPAEEVSEPVTETESPPATTEEVMTPPISEVPLVDLGGGTSETPAEEPPPAVEESVEIPPAIPPVEEVVPPAEEVIEPPAPPVPAPEVVLDVPPPTSEVES